jgi:hypothetical protein
VRKRRKSCNIQCGIWYLHCQERMEWPHLLPHHGDRTNINEKMTERTYYICGSERATERCCSQRTVLHHGIVGGLARFESSPRAVQMRQIVIAANDRPNKTQFSIFVCILSFSLFWISIA